MVTERLPFRDHLGKGGENGHEGGGHEIVLIKVVLARCWSTTVEVIWRVLRSLSFFEIFWTPNRVHVLCLPAFFCCVCVLKPLRDKSLQLLQDLPSLESAELLTAPS